MKWFLVLAVVSGIQAQYSHHIVANNDYTVSWATRDDILYMEMAARTRGFVAVGFSPSGGMKGADIIVGNVLRGQPLVKDYHGVGNTNPIEDSKQDVSLESGYQNETHTVIRFSRPLKTCDEDDYQLDDSTVRLIWAFGSTDGLQYHGSGNRGVRSTHIMGKMQNLASLEGQKYWDVKSPNVTINSNRTTIYWCNVVKLPEEFNRKKHHIVGFKPAIKKGNEEFVHHSILSACYTYSKEEEEMLEKYSRGHGHECYTSEMPKEYSNCRQYIAVWAVGDEGVANENFGIPLGERYGGSTYMLLETHYDNPNKKQVYEETSGFRIFVSERLRFQEAQSIAIGSSVSPALLIPPHQKQFKIVGHCNTDCLTAGLAPSGGYIHALMNHAHLAGRGIALRHIRNGKELEPITNDKHYDFNYQQTRTLDKPRHILQGDHLITECEYDTMDRDNVTYGGLSTKEEMCIIFILMTPRPIDVVECFSIPSQYSEYRSLGVEDIFIDNYVAYFTGNYGTKRNHDFPKTGADEPYFYSIQSPEKFKHKNLFEYINNFDWNNEVINKLQDDMTNGPYHQRCLRINHTMAWMNWEDFYPKFDKFVPPTKNCI